MVHVAGYVGAARVTPPVSSDRWRQIEILYHAALERDPVTRAAFLLDACANDPELLREVESLLAQPVKTRSFLASPARRIGDYELIGLLGAGGMGEVYRAHDTRLRREVAIKILPATFAADPERVSRFEREARLLASLNHPNIATIHGIERVDSAPAIIMELVAGETLAERIARGPLRVTDAVAIARQVAVALDSAHEKGIVHRDLKPANVKITPDGAVKVLDFGLAKATGAGIAPMAGRADGTVSATTRDGLIIGTPAYMSPEQARGQIVDKRTDIWAFGCVLFEMLTGRAAFMGATVTDILAAVLEREPTWTALPQAIAPGIVRVIRRCLEKDPRRRLRDIADAAVDLEDGGSLAPAVASRAWRTHTLWASGAILLVALAAWAAWSGAPRSTPQVIRTALVLSGNQRLVSNANEYPLALSPDGTTLAFVAKDNGEAQLYVRPLSASEARAIPGTSDAKHPFFSPDGHWIAFFAGGALQKVAVAGGTPLRIVTVPNVSMGGAWGPDGTIVWATRGADLMRVSAAGGVPTALPGSAPAAWPDILPDGKTVLFATGVALQGNSAIGAMSLAGGPKRIVARTLDSTLEGPAVLGAGAGIAQVRYLSNGVLVYGQSANPGALRALPFDAATLEPHGPPLPLADSLERAANGGGVYFAVSRTLLLYATTRDRHRLVWVDRTGAETPISPDRAAFRDVRLSPDGLQIAVTINDETRRSDVWIYAAEGGTKRRLTAEGHNLRAVWTPDGQRVTFSDGRIVEILANGAGEKQVLIDSPEIRAKIPQGTTAYPTAWARDGVLLFQADQREVWAFSRAKIPSLRRLLTVHGDVHHAQVSADGHWIAYASDESGRSEVYIRPYPDLGEATPVSTNGGNVPHWSRTGREIFFRAGDALMAADIETTPRLRASPPRHLFGGAYAGAARSPDFDVSLDGKRFVMVKSDEASVLNQLTVVENWAEELKRPTARTEAAD